MPRMRISGVRMNPKKELFNRSKMVWVAYALLLCASAWVFLSDTFGHLIVNADDFHYLTQSARISENFGALLDPHITVRVPWQILSSGWVSSCGEQRRNGSIRW